MRIFPLFRRTLALLASFAFVFTIIPGLRAQDVASITGLVTDTTGALIPGADVTLQNTATGATYVAIANELGSYTIANVPPGPGYSLTISHAGFNSAVITGMYMNVNSTRTQNARLTVGSTTQTVEVSANSETVTLNTTDATVGNNFQAQFLNTLPVANRDNPAALFTQQPGTTLDGAVTGARTDQNNVTLDGLDVNDIFTGQFGAIIGHAPVDSVQEFRGVTAGQLSSSGQGGGGQYELVTRSGTNKFHGALVEYHRDTALEANNWFNNDTTPITPRPPLIRNQFGGNIGGPIKRDKAFFFFDWNSRRDTLSDLVERTVPTDAFRNGTIVYYTNYKSRITKTLSSSGIAALDPQGKGFNSSLLTVLTSRYPHANDLSGNYGDSINTAGFRFNAPFPRTDNDYVGRIDYSLSSSQKLWGRVTFARTDATQSAIQFPGDPETHPFLDKSHAWVVGHTWTIGSNKTNEASWGETVTNYNFPNTYNPTGTTQYCCGFGGNGTGGTILSGPYGSAINAQNRLVPIPIVRDDFSWLKGRHNFQFGGTFKYINPDSNTILDYDEPTIGLGGNMNTLGSASTLRPSDIDPAATGFYDRAFTFALGRYASIQSTYNYDAKGSVLPQGTGSQDHYRFFETELYFGDTWKLTPAFTVSYGVRWQNYSVPYEKNGIESLPNMNFDQYFGARVAQSKAGQSGNSTVPFISYSLGGKANNAPGYFHPQYTNFAPRLAFAWSPGRDRKSVFSGGAGIIYDHTVVNAVQYQAEQYSYLFQASANRQFGTPGKPIDSLNNDPRFSGFSSPPAPPAAPTALTPPYTPFVSKGVPLGLRNNQFNEGVTNNLKTPYSIMYNLGFQHELPADMLLKTTYVGRLGRRLLAQADANQLIDFPDPQSGQLMSQAFTNIEQEMRTTGTVTPQPWLENVITPGTGEAFGFANNTELVAYGFDPLPFRGDFADTIQGLSTLNRYFPILPSNVGMGSQFAEFTYYTNMGFSSYNGFLVTLVKNNTHGLQFDLNYTWSHSIDNVSIIANEVAFGGYGFICDVLRPRQCRGNSDFDVSQYFNGNFIYDLPFGRGRTFGADVPVWMNEVIGGWDLSGLPAIHGGNVTFATSNAFVAGYANDAPAILTGPVAKFKSHPNKGADGTLWAFQSGDDSGINDFVGPIGFQEGSRNNLRGPRYFNLDLGLAKTFPIYGDRVNLRFRCDAFNALNHPSFSRPDPMDNLDITETAGTFGVITSTANSARVLQLALRLEF
jgi:hypothetical protein